MKNAGDDQLCLGFEASKWGENSAVPSCVNHELVESSGATVISLAACRDAAASHVKAQQIDQERSLLDKALASVRLF